MIDVRCVIVLCEILHNYGLFSRETSQIIRSEQAAEGDNLTQT